MSGSETSAGDRTEAPTQKRMQDAREAGQLPVSRDLTMLASLGAGTIGCLYFVPAMGVRLANQCANLLGALDLVRVDDAAVLRGQLGDALVTAALLIAAVAGPAIAGSVICTLVQTQFYVGGAPIKLQPSRISPIAGFARLVSSRHLLDFLKSCLRLGVLGLLAWGVLRQAPDSAIAVMGADAGWLLPAADAQVSGFVRPMLIALACFAAADVFLVRFQHTKSIRMSREQVRLEHRDTEGDPFIKAKLRRIRKQRAKRRMMAKVKTADVVITNPTHYAVALIYQRGGTAAPRVVAKGADNVAARIREEAGKHSVPIVANPPLARALFQVELDEEVPGEHYRAVAEVIAYVWKLKTRFVVTGARL